MKFIEAVIFDLEGTLFVCPQLCKKHLESVIDLIAIKRSVSVGKAERLLFSVQHDLSMKLGYQPALVTTVAMLGINRTEFFRCIESTDPAQFLQSDHRLKETLSQFKQLYKVGLLTNVGRKAVIAILHALGLNPSEFDAIISGDEVHENKPALVPFLKILATLEVQPSRAVMVGDRSTIDLIPAKTLGMATILIDKSRKFSRFADIVVDDVADVYPAILHIKYMSGGYQVDNC